MKQGDRLNSITVIETLYTRGAGGVYIGLNNEDKEMVSVKTLFSDFAEDATYRQQFKDEANAYRMLNHPNIVRYVDSGFDKGIHFIATEFVKGKTLSELTNGFKLPVDMVLKIMRHLADGIAHAHDKGILHCDLRPDNIMINEEGIIKVVDFGNVKCIGAKAYIDANQRLRSPRYSSPEQNQGQDLDERSDLYGLGLLFYEMLTGMGALNGHSLLEITAFQMKCDFILPSLLSKAVPSVVDEVVMKLLERERNNRHPSAFALIEDIMELKQKLGQA